MSMSVDPQLLVINWKLGVSAEYMSRLHLSTAHSEMISVK